MEIHSVEFIIRKFEFSRVQGMPNSIEEKFQLTPPLSHYRVFEKTAKKTTLERVAQVAAEQNLVWVGESAKVLLVTFDLTEISSVKPWQVFTRFFPYSQPQVVAICPLFDLLITTRSERVQHM